MNEEFTILGVKPGSPEAIAKVIAMSAVGLEKAREENPQYRLERPPKAHRKPVEAGKRGWTEKDFQREFRLWAVNNGTSTAVFECKTTPDDSLPFSRLEPHQKEFLLKAKSGKAYYHPSDYGNFMGVRQKLPCDAMLFCGAKAFVVVQFRVKERGNRDFYLVGIEEWCREEESSDRKSLTEIRAGQIGARCHL